MAVTSQSLPKVVCEEILPTHKMLLSQFCGKAFWRCLGKNQSFSEAKRLNGQGLSQSVHMGGCGQSLKSRGSRKCLQSQKQLGKKHFSAGSKRSLMETSLKILSPCSPWGQRRQGITEFNPCHIQEAVGVRESESFSVKDATHLQHERPNAMCGWKAGAQTAGVVGEARDLSSL